MQVPPVIATIQDEPSPPTSPELEEGEIDELAEEKEAGVVGNTLNEPEVQPTVLAQRHDLPADTDDDIYV